MEEFLKKAEISYVAVTSRIKDFESFWEKIFRKHYEMEPFKQIGDICGLRIILYEPSDLSKIKAIIKREFVVKSVENKIEALKPDQFGYRGTHYIIGIKPKWQKTPNYRDLNNIFAELQVCTILMHAWAEIEHKFAYKNQNQIPKSLKRQYSQLSAILEVADGLLGNISRNRNKLLADMESNAQEHGSFDRNLSLDLDTLQALLTYYYSDRVKDSRETIQELLGEINEAKLTMGNLIDYIDNDMEKALSEEKEWQSHQKEPDQRFTQVGIMRVLLWNTNPEYVKVIEMKRQQAFSSDYPDDCPDDCGPEDSEPDDCSPEDSEPDDCSPEDSEPDDYSPEDSEPEDCSPEDSEPDDCSPEDSEPDDCSPEDE